MIEMNEQTIERVAKHMAAFNGDPDAWGAYASQAMDVIELAEDQWQPIETAPKDGTVVDLWAVRERSKRAGRYADCHWGQQYFGGEAFGRPIWNGLLDSHETVTPTHWRPLTKPPKN